jgi:hypothetical protein
MNNQRNIVRYLVVKNEEVPASYSSDLGVDVAYSYAKQNARRFDSKIFAVNAAGEMQEVEFRKRR